MSSFSSVPAAKTSLSLISGERIVISWPGRAALLDAVNRFCADATPLCRYVGGSLLAELTLTENILLESALSRDAAPDWLWPELHALFAAAGCPLDSRWAARPAATAMPTARLQTQVGRALAADPDCLLIDAREWPDAVLSPEHFTRAFQERYPWRTLAWFCDTPERADALQARLAGPSQ